MYKKFTIAAIMIILVSMIFSPAVLSSETNTADESGGFELRSIFAASSVLQVSFDEDDVTEAVIPTEGFISIPLNISYWLTGIFAKWQSRVFKNRDVQIDLSIIDKPEWSDVSLAPLTILANVTPSASDSIPGEAILHVSVDESAPAFTQGKVVIQATAPAIKGLFDIITKVRGCNETFEIPFTVGYLPVIKIELDKDYMEVPPLNVTKIPINITNLGNGATLVKIEVENESGNYTVNYPNTIVLGSLVSDEENKKQVEIAIQLYKNSSMESIIIKFTPQSIHDPDLKGQTIVKTLILENDGSLKEEEEESEINSTLLLVVIVVIVLVLIFSIILKKRK